MMTPFFSPKLSGPGNSSVTLDVYVISGCANCEYARGLASRVADAFPSVHVQVVDLMTLAEPPEAVFAAPTYVVNGKVVSLGNPDDQELFALLQAAQSSS